MIESVRIKNFQSLQDIDLELGKFTVIVGASSSGKSALTRAIKAVASNALDSDYITRGTKSSSVSLRTDNTVVTIEREVGGSSAYKVVKMGSQESSFTKLNRQVPSEITEVLGITPSSKEVESIHFAGQFDTPYLLRDSASNVARILGELTNVSTIFSAVRESSRRAKSASTILNLRRKDEEKLLVEISQYSTVAKQAKAVSRAEELFLECSDVDRQLSDLTTLAENFFAASQQLEAITEIPELPDLQPLLDAQTNLVEFKELVRTLVLTQNKLTESQSSITEAESAILLAEEELHQTLVEAGSCPTCNQKVS